ncbi:MAG: succinate dehydrogenase, hydrophobic membrane anchor protein [Gammaproteobacteria bacterium]
MRSVQFRSALSQVRGLGSAKEGTKHFWMQRVTAVALVPLSLWFAASLAVMTGAEYEAAYNWLRSPIVGVLMLGMVVALFYHAYLGLRIVVEDYVHGEGLKVASLVALKLILFALGVGAMLAVLKVFLGAPA